MPPLRRPRQELFVRNLIAGAKKGVTQREAYVAAGYSVSRVEYADASASRLASSVKVKERMDEITRPVVARTRVSVASLLDELAITVKDAREAKQHSAVIAALALMAKLVGLLREQIEIGRPGEFKNCETPQDVIDQIREELGDDAARALEIVRGFDGDPRETLALLDGLRANVIARIEAEARDVTPEPEIQSTI